MSQIVKSKLLNSHTAVIVLGRSVQLMCVAAFIYGCSRIPALASTFKKWQVGGATFSQLNLDLLRVTLPTWLAWAIFRYFEIIMRRDRDITRMLSERPDAPWLCHSIWRTDVLPTSGLVSWTAFAWGLTTFVWVGVPLAAISSSERNLAWLCLLVGVLSILFAINQWRTKEWRRAELRLITRPGIIGGPFTGVFSIRRSFAPDSIFSATLQCTYLLPATASDESDNTRRIFWSAAIEIKSPDSSIPQRTELPIRFSIPIGCPDSSIIPGEKGSANGIQKAGSYRDVRWELLVQKKNAAGLGLARFLVPVFHTTESEADYSPDQALLHDLTPTYDAPAILRLFDFEETAMGPNCTKLTFRLRDQALLKSAMLLTTICIVALIAIVLVVPNLMFQLFLGFLPAMVLLAIGINLGENWLWRGEIVRDHDQLIVNCGIPYVHPPLQCVANEQIKLSCKVGSQSQNQVLESWNLYISFPNGQERLLIRQLGSRVEAATIQDWLARRLGIGVDPIDMASGFSSAEK